MPSGAIGDARMLSKVGFLTSSGATGDARVGAGVNANWMF